MHRFDRRELKSFLSIFACMAVGPLIVLLTRPRPLAAATSGELVQLARDSRQNEVLNEMQHRYQAVSLNLEGFDPTENPDYQWRQIQSILRSEGAEPVEAFQVAKAARKTLKENWPCTAERGYLNGQPVWLVVGSTPTYSGRPVWVCMPTAAEVQREKVSQFCSNTQVAIVSATAPYAALNCVNVVSNANTTLSFTE